MRHIFGLVVLASLAFVPIGNSAPIGGSWSSGNRVAIENRAWTKTMTFRGGERAAVLAIGDHKETGVKIQVAVYDAKNQLVAEDKRDSEQAGEYGGLVWYPPRDGEYRIEVRQVGAAANSVYIAIK